MIKKYILLLLKLACRRIFFITLKGGKYRLILTKRQRDKDTKDWHKAWEDQHKATGVNYWYGYTLGYDDAMSGVERRTKYRK